MRKLVEAPRKPRETQKTRRENLWVLEMFDNPSVEADLNYNVDFLIAKAQGVAWGKGPCVACKGGKFLCGKTRCPMLHACMPLMLCEAATPR